MALETTLTRPPDSLLGASDRYLTLQIRGGEHDGRVLRLRSQKCTIGSGPLATLRLRGRGFRPLHCLILRGTAGTFVQRWSPDTCLNGRAFSVARLQPGDRLHVAYVEFEVLDNGRVSEFHASSSPGNSAAPGNGPTNPTIRQVDQQADQWVAERESLASQLNQLEQENRRLVVQIAELQQQHEASTQQAEQLIHSLQQEGKDLLAQLQEAKYAIRHDTAMRRQIESEVADEDGGNVGD